MVCSLFGAYSQPLDVASALQPQRSRKVLLLSLCFGLMSNLDIGTEHLRWGRHACFVRVCMVVLWAHLGAHMVAGSAHDCGWSMCLP